MSQASYLAPITELSDSSSDHDDGRVDAPAAKKAKRGGNGVAPSTDVRSLLNTLCQCSKDRKTQGQTCFLKFKGRESELEDLREQFQSLHKLDQDQVDT